jgi:hypothetical protein
MDGPDEALRLPFVFVPEGAEPPASWRAAHPDAVALGARLVVRWMVPPGAVRESRRPVPAQWWLPLLSRPPGTLPRLMERALRNPAEWLLIVPEMDEPT